MVKINGNGHFLAFASKSLLCCFVLIVIGPICRTTAANKSIPVVKGITDFPGHQYVDSPVLVGLSVYYIDQILKTLYRYQAEGNLFFSVPVAVQAGNLSFMVAVRSADMTKFAIGYGTEIGVFPWSGTNSTEVLLENKLSITDDSTYNMHFGKVDSSGRLWIGAGYAGNTVGCLFTVDPDGTVTRKMDGTAGPVGGITWSLDDKTMYYSRKDRIYSLPFDVAKPELKKENSLLIFDFAEHGFQTVNPHGMTTDTDGNLWIACRASSYIFQISPKLPLKETFLTYIDLNEAASVSALVFGGQDMQDLYVTDIKGVYRVTNTGSTGVDEYKCDVRWPKNVP